MRLLLASAVALLGLTAVSGFTLHQVFENQARNHLIERSKVLAQAAAAFLSIADAGDGEDRLAELVLWLKTDPDFESIRLLDEQGSVLFISRIPAAQSSSTDLSPFIAAAAGRREARTLQVEVALSPIRLARELDNIRWLSASIALLAGAFFAALSVYLTRGIVLPLEEVRRAACRIASGEANVRIPVSGDWEIDELAHFFQSLAERRIVPGTVRPKLDPSTAPTASRSTEA